MDRYTSRQQTAQQAMDIQDACNISGVLKTAFDMANYIKETAGGNPATKADKAPELVLMVSKIASLIECEGPSGMEFNKAWEACEKLAKGEPVAPA